MANWIFMAPESVAIHFSTRAEGDMHDTEFAEDLATHLQGVTNLTVLDVVNTDTHAARRRTEFLFKEPEWKLVSAEQKAS